MTLNEAICHAEEVAEENYGKATAYLSDTRVYEYEEQKCLKCADEHMQLAEWLKDYKRLKEQESKTGHWITKDRLYPKCDQCGWEYGSDMANFCPNCGADMRGKEV